MVRPFPAHAAATSCTVPSPPTATTDSSSGSPRTMLPAWPGLSVTCQTGRNPRPSRNPETNARNSPARPLPASGLRTRCTSPPEETTAGKYQKRTLATRTEGHSGSTRGVDCDEGYAFQPGRRKHPTQEPADAERAGGDAFAGKT